jgi:heterotetrameric sarcosine oxidase gamma subunit
MSVSAPEVRQPPGAAGGVALASCLADIVELAALKGRAPELQEIAGSRGWKLPAHGRIALANDTLALCVRPQRWLLLSAPGAAGAVVSRWQGACAGVAAAVDHSCGLAALYLTGVDAREVLVRGCRVDLDPRVFPTGHAAATIMAQVAAILAAVPSGMLIVTPASTARHLREWLAAAARPFGLAMRGDVTVSALSGDPHS